MGGERYWGPAVKKEGGGVGEQEGNVTVGLATRHQNTIMVYMDNSHNSSMQ